MGLSTLVELDEFLRPMFLDLDGASRVAEVERIGAIARRLYTPAPEEIRPFELLLRFHRLGRWLEKVGNLSRTALVVRGVTESELRRTSASIARLGEPVTDGERAVAAAVLIDGAGVRGLTELFARSRREGNDLMDVLRAAMTDAAVPAWLSPRAGEWLHARREARREVCATVLQELQMGDLS